MIDDAVEELTKIELNQSKREGDDEGFKQLSKLGILSKSGKVKRLMQQKIKQYECC